MFKTGADKILTMSVVDLSKLDALKTAYANFGNAAFNFAQKNPADIVQTVTNFKRTANRAEKYPAKSVATHFNFYFAPCLVDLKGFAKNVGENIPELKSAGDELTAAVKGAVVYQKRGDSLNRGGGLYGFLYNSILPYMHTVNVPTLQDGQQLVDQTMGKPLTHAQ